MTIPGGEVKNYVPNPEIKTFSDFIRYVLSKKGQEQEVHELESEGQGLREILTQEHLEQMAELPFEVGALEWAEITDDQVQEKQISVFSQWVEDELSSVPLTIDREKNHHKLVSAKKVEIWLQIHNHPSSEGIAPDVVLLPSPSDLVATTGYDAVVSKQGIVVFSVTDMTVKDFLTDFPGKETMGARDFLEKLGGPDALATNLINMPFFDDFMLKCLLSKADLKVRGQEYLDLIAVFRKDKGYLKKLALSFFKVPVLVGPLSSASEILKNTTKSDLKPFEWDFLQDETSPFALLLRQLLERQENGENLEEEVAEVKKGSLEEAFFNAILELKGWSRNVRLVHGSNNYLVTPDTVYDLVTVGEQQPGDRVVENNHRLDRTQFIVKLARSFSSFFGRYSNRPYYFEFNGISYRMTKEMVLKAIESARVSR